MKRIKYLICASLIVVPPAFSQGEKRGLTWGRVEHDPSRGIDLVGCDGTPKPRGGNACNAYTGDTPCSRSLPILCIKKDGSPRPDYSVANRSHAEAKEYYAGWAQGSIRLTPPIKGSDIEDLNHANSVCADNFGDGYRMAEHHDGRWVAGMDSNRYFASSWPKTTNEGGWNFWAYGNVGHASRFWVHIRDQDANCWRGDRASQTTPHNEQTIRGKSKGLISPEYQGSHHEQTIRGNIKGLVSPEYQEN